MEISTWSKFTAGFIAMFLLFSGLAAGDYYYNNQDSYSVTGDSEFSVPQYESQEEIATELVAPFLFIVIILRFAFQKVLFFTFAEDDRNRVLTGQDDFRSKFSREATMMSIAVAGMMIPTPFWEYVRLVASSIGLLTAGIILLIIFYFIWSFING